MLTDKLVQLIECSFDYNLKKYFFKVVYFLQELEGDNDVFSISTYNGKGKISLVKSLDYETKNLYQLKVLAVDRASHRPINTGTAAIVVKIRDVEDQPPVFSAVSPVTRISEDAAIDRLFYKVCVAVQLSLFIDTLNVFHLSIVKAHDGDRGINNPIKYSILSGGNDLFGINEKTGVVYTRKSLDREDSRNQENGAYILEILATEQSKLKVKFGLSNKVASGVAAVCIQIFSGGRHLDKNKLMCL